MIDRGMKKNNAIDKFMSTGIWLWPVIAAGIYWMLKRYNPEFLNRMDHPFLLIAVIALIPCLLFWISSLGSPSKEKGIVGKDEALYPLPPDKLLFKEPTGICMGLDKRSGLYVCKPLSPEAYLDGHYIGLGQSGSGKSSAAAMPTIIACLVLDMIRHRKDKGYSGIAMFILDIKSELGRKTIKIGGIGGLPGFHVFNPQDRTTEGWDVFYRLTDESPEQDVLEVMMLIAISLVPKSQDPKNEVWTDGGAKLLTGLMIRYWHLGTRTGQPHDFISIIDRILSAPVAEQISKAIEETTESSNERKYLMSFAGLAEETLGSYWSNASRPLLILSTDQNLRYALRDNPKKLDPTYINRGESIDCAIAENKLQDYSDIIRIIISQLMDEKERAKEGPDLIPSVLMIDEMARIGRLQKVVDSIKTLRSKKCTCMFLTQNVAGLKESYSDNEVSDILGNCAYWEIFSSFKNKETTDIITAECGKYRARKTSWNGSGKNAKLSTSYEDLPLIEASDLNELIDRNEAIVITDAGYIRVQKVSIYSDPYLRPIYEEAYKYNTGDQH